jgi:hypothetical protein
LNKCAGEARFMLAFRVEELSMPERVKSKQQKLFGENQSKR